MPRELNRRQFLEVAAAATAAALAAAGCAPRRPSKPNVMPTSTPNAELMKAADAPHDLVLTPDGKMFDEAYFNATGQKIEFYVDPKYNDPDFPGPSLAAEVQTNKPGFLRYAAWEVQPPAGTQNPASQEGGLVDVTYFVDGKTPQIKHPVTGEQVGEQDKVGIGFAPQTSPNMDMPQNIPCRMYQVQRTADGLKVRYVNTATVPFQMPLRGN